MNKKAFMAAMAVSALLFLCVGLHFMEVAKADQFLTCSLTVTNPNASFNYTSTMPLDLNIAFDNKTNQPIIWIQANVTYAIDQGGPVNITSLPSYAHPEPNGTLAVPVSQSVNITGLEEGQHTLTITVEGYYDLTNSALPDFSQTFSPVYFYVGGNSSSPTLTASLAESASSVYFGNPVNFTVTVEGGTPPYSYAWYLDNQLAQTTTSPYYSNSSMPMGNHHVYVTVTDASNTTSTTLTFEFSVFTYPSSTPGASSSPTLAPSPSVPEFQTWIILPLATVVSAMLGYFCVRRRKP
jgi:hypothetical protein